MQFLKKSLQTWRKRSTLTCQCHSFSRIFLISMAVTSLVCALAYLVISTSQIDIRLRFNSQTEKTLSPGLSSGSPSHLHLQLKEPGRSEDEEYVVDTPTCKIPAMNPWDDSIQAYIDPSTAEPPVDCRATHRAWIYTNGTEIILNATAVVESGFSPSSIRCCYRVIERVDQLSSEYDWNADSTIKFSEICHRIKQYRQKIDAEFIRVYCTSNSVPLFEDVVYRDYLALAQPESDRFLTSKILRWNTPRDMGASTVENSAKPPNVVIVGIDNTSRMNSHRTLKNTLEKLRRMGAVEMLGYTKVGENTFPNTVAFMSGFSEAELIPICYTGNNDSQNDCPYVWKAFDKVGYLTATAEDMPFVGGFNYMKTGFLRRPTDFYLRPLMVAAFSLAPREEYWSVDCIGHSSNEQFVLDYMRSALNLASSTGSPLFLHSWITTLGHADFNKLRFGDDVIAEFVDFLEALPNTIFFLMSDHGQRFGKIRETTQGWFEDRLPMQWVYLPPSLRERFPTWYSDLKTNSARLTSHFDLFKTMLHVLGEFDEEKLASEFYKQSESQRGQSLFVAMDENRTCEDAGISINYCACSKPEQIALNGSEVRGVAEAGVAHLQNMLPLDVCASPKLERIVSASEMKLPRHTVYVVSFVTSPGDFLFEVNVEATADGELVVTTDLLRMNKISRAAKCVRTPVLERYCYCK